MYVRSPKLNTTSFIKNQLFSLSRGLTSSNYITEGELRVIKNNQVYISDELPDENLAATFSIYDAAKKQLSSSCAAKLGSASSAMFSRHYMTELDLISPTGYFNSDVLEDYDNYP